MTDLLIRPLAPQDRDALVAIWHRSWHDAHGALVRADIAATRDRGYFARLFDQHLSKMIGLFACDGLVAFAVIADTDYIDQFHVAPDRRGTGLAATFLAMVESQILQSARNRVRLSCAVGNERARRFYLRHGYRVTGREFYAFPVPDGMPPLTLPIENYEKTLVHLRPYAQTDSPALAALWHGAWHEAHDSLFAAEIVAMRTPATFLARLEPLAQGLIIAETGGTMAGFAALEGNEIDQFYLASGTCGSGLAAVLLGAAEAELSRRGVTDAVIQCSAGNLRAHRFYSKRGWHDSGIANLPIWMPHSRMIKHPCHVFRKRITTADTVPS